MTSSMPTCAGHRARGALVVAGEQHRAQAHARAAWRPPPPTVGLTVSATTSTPRTCAVPGDEDGGLARSPRPARRARPAASRDRRAPTRRPARPPGRPGRRARRPRRRRRGRGRRRTRDASSGRGGSPRRAAIAPTGPGAPGARRDRGGDRVLGRRTRPRRPAGAVRVSSRRGQRATSVSAIRPVVTVPVLSSTMVSTRRVVSSTSGPLIRMPSCAPRPVPTRIAVGVARPIAHGQAMISTATAAVNALAADPPGGQPAGQRRGGDHEHDRDEHGGDPVGEPLHRRLARLRLGDQPGDLGELGVRADPGGPDQQPAARR